MVGRGLHHITLISSDAERSCRFYAGLLGMRLVKRTVSYEDPGSFHLCMGDEKGRPGTLFTLLPWQRVQRGRLGACEAWATTFRVPDGSLDWWAQRLQAAGVRHDRVETAFGERSVLLEDPDGASLSLVEKDEPVSDGPWRNPHVPDDCAIQGLHDLVLKVRRADPLIEMFREVFGFARCSTVGNLSRLEAHGGAGGVVTLDEAKRLARGQLGAGSIHHVAIRAHDAADLATMVRELRDRYGIIADEVRNRTYYRAVKFRSTCGLLLEIATDEPGFEFDESYETLGRTLKLPSSLEMRRDELQQLLPLLPECGRHFFEDAE
ncbi:VOC family protein [Microvirga lotononidis]|uniref:Lactoylglutathione lyase-like lyase n=1 Tax=Microvirga lotononidis TaxID=864069 RepID=I4YPV2_9HYPH|nr:VOC family protein [Microvirga lotononidis]EIM25994.1 lactoylglutathione lyase-like lyase [Microvirga lotononidis]WQO25903.1 VOC family protein [Microvirga lotononidis]